MVSGESPVLNPGRSVVLIPRKAIKTYSWKRGTTDPSGRMAGETTVSLKRTK